jgi:Family of unknown function (DUF5719)
VNVRRIPMLVVVAVAGVGLVTNARERVEPDVASFSTAAVGWMPSAPLEGGLTETWFCPGVPATGSEGVEGTVVVANRTGEQRVGSALVYNEQSQNVRVPITIDGWSIVSIDLDATLPGAMVGVLVEVDGGGVLVEQQSVHPSGNSSHACANATSDTWYLAEGTTIESSLDQIVLSNPYDQTIVASLEFATREGSRAPGSYAGLTVPARSTRVIDLGAPGAGAQGEPILAVQVETTRGRIVVGRFQRFLGGGRLGTQVTLASPSTRDQWWFTNGRKGAGFSERYSIYNPTDDDVQVDTIFLGVATSPQVEPIEVPSNEVVVFDPSELAELPDGGYVVVFATFAGGLVVVERSTTQTIAEQVGTSVVHGATPRTDGFLARTWLVPVAPAQPVTAALVIHNADNADGTVTVSAIGASGPVPVPGLTDVVLPVAQRITLDLTDPTVLGRSIVVQSTNRIFVEQAFPSGRGDLRVSSWAIPAE